MTNRHADPMELVPADDAYAPLYGVVAPFTDDAPDAVSSMLLIAADAPVRTPDIGAHSPEEMLAAVETARADFQAHLLAATGLPSVVCINLFYGRPEHGAAADKLGWKKCGGETSVWWQSNDSVVAQTVVFLDGPHAGASTNTPPRLSLTTDY